MNFEDSSHSDGAKSTKLTGLKVIGKILWKKLGFKSRLALIDQVREFVAFMHFPLFGAKRSWNN